MPWGVAAAAIGAAGSIGGGILASQGAEQHTGAMGDAINFGKKRFHEGKANLTPYVQFGREQLGDLSEFLRDKNPMNFRDPGYQFRFDQGLKSIEGSAAAGGNLLSGDTLRALTQYGQDMASQEYANAFGRYIDEGQFRRGLAGMGQAAATDLGQLGVQSSANLAGATNNAGYGNSDMIWGNTIAGLGGVLGNTVAKNGENWFNKWRNHSNTPNGPNAFKLNPADDAIGV